MKRSTLLVILFALSAVLFATHSADAAKPPVKVFILAGQSNMVGPGVVDFSESRTNGYLQRGLTEEQIAKKRSGALEYLVKDPTRTERYQHLIDTNGDWVVRDDVWICYNRKDGMRKGGLTVGFGARDDKIGPELQFGHRMGDALDEQVLLIKTAWGGKSLAVDFRSPSMGKIDFPMHPNLEAKVKEDPELVGRYYRLMLEEVKSVLENLGDHFPDYEGQGYKIVGFCWHQGWNDGCDEQCSITYASNILKFIPDVRRDFGVADLPVVIAGSGFGGTQPRGGVVGRLQKYVQPAQAAAAEKLERVRYIDTREFYRPEDISPGRGDIEHWYSNAESYFLIGDSLGREMTGLLAK